MNLDHPIFEPALWQRYLLVGQEHEDVAMITMARLILRMIECAGQDDTEGMRGVVRDFEANYALFDRRIAAMKVKESEVMTRELLDNLKILITTMRNVLESEDG